MKIKMKAAPRPVLIMPSKLVEEPLSLMNRKRLDDYFIQHQDTDDYKKISLAFEKANPAHVWLIPMSENWSVECYSETVHTFIDWKKEKGEL